MPITLLTRQNLNGGPKLKICPITVDEDTGTLYHKVGYCSHCNNPLGIKTIDIKEVISHFAGYNNEYKKSIRERIIEALGGKYIVDK